MKNGTKLIRQLADDSGLRSEQTFQTCNKFQIVKILYLGIINDSK